MLPNIYNYHPVTRLLISEGLADADPMDSENYLIPANATIKEPPQVGEKQAALFIDNEWSVVPDHRNEVWYDENRNEITIDEVNFEPDPEWTLQPKPKNIEELKQEKLADINSEFDKSMQPIINGIPSIERESWKKQEEEARSYQANNSAATPLIDALSASRGVTKAELVTRIINKADLYATISGQLIGKRQKLEDQLAALPVEATAEDVAEIVW